MAEDPKPDLVERLITKDLIETDTVMRQLSRTAMQSQRSVESYLSSGVKPRWMQRLMDIDRGLRKLRARLEVAYEQLQAECATDRAAFAARWRERAAAEDLGELNELIEQHNAWYPIERDLPIDLRTRDYVLVGGRSYRREPLDLAWVLREFPPER